MDDQDTRIVEYRNLNTLGKAVFLTGAAARFAADLIETAVDHAAGMVTDAERAFRQGLDPNVDDAKILEERDRSSSVMRQPPRP